MLDTASYTDTSEDTTTLEADKDLDVDFETPPHPFFNRINTLKEHGQLSKGFTWAEWRKSPEWKTFLAGYNLCVDDAKAAIEDRRYLGRTARTAYVVEGTER